MSGGTHLQSQILFQLPGLARRCPGLLGGRLRSGIPGAQLFFPELARFKWALARSTRPIYAEWHFGVAPHTHSKLDVAVRSLIRAFEGRGIERYDKSSSDCQVFPRE